MARPTLELARKIIPAAKGDLCAAARLRAQLQRSTAYVVRIPFATAPLLRNAAISAAE